MGMYSVVGQVSVIRVIANGAPANSLTLCTPLHYDYPDLLSECQQRACCRYAKALFKNRAKSNFEISILKRFGAKPTSCPEVLSGNPMAPRERAQQTVQYATSVCSRRLFLPCARHR